MYSETVDESAVLVALDFLEQTSGLSEGIVDTQQHFQLITFIKAQQLFQPAFDETHIHILHIQTQLTDHLVKGLFEGQVLLDLGGLFLEVRVGL